MNDQSPTAVVAPISQPMCIGSFIHPYIHTTKIAIDSWLQKAFSLMIEVKRNRMKEMLIKANQSSNVPVVHSKKMWPFPFFLQKKLSAILKNVLSHDCNDRSRRRAMKEQFGEV
jgi:hypothetical protein